MCIRDSYILVIVVERQLRLAPRDARRRQLAVELAVERLACLLYTSDAADERSSVDLGGRRIIKKKKEEVTGQRVGRTSTETPRC